MDLYDASVIDPLGRVRQAKYGDKADYAADYADFGRRLMTHVTVSSALGARHINYLAYDPLGREAQRGETRDNDATGPKTSALYDPLRLAPAA